MSIVEIISVLKKIVRSKDGLFGGPRASLRADMRPFRVPDLALPALLSRLPRLNNLTGHPELSGLIDQGKLQVYEFPATNSTLPTLVILDTLGVVAMYSQGHIGAPAGTRQAGVWYLSWYRQGIGVEVRPFSSLDAAAVRAQANVPAGDLGTSLSWWTRKPRSESRLLDARAVLRDLLG